MWGMLEYYLWWDVFQCGEDIGLCMLIVSFVIDGSLLLWFEFDVV